jgi:mannose-6-phosphate isomerase
MSLPPQPVVFEPILKPKPWGGRRLETFFGKRLPPGQVIGESWELASLPGAESRVRGGPLGGCTLAELVDMWGRGLYGGAELIEGRFPLLIKFLDARERLSVQVHARPDPDQPYALSRGVKHEAWYVVDAQPGAELLAGVKPGTSAGDLARAAETGGIARLLRSWPAERGAVFFLPSGVVHALGAGMLVAEVQTPGDVTYRLYDWDRVEAGGRRRQLHVGLALENACLEVAPDVIRPSGRRKLSDMPGEALAGCAWFRIDGAHIRDDADLLMGPGQMMAWMILSGRGTINCGAHGTQFASGDVVLVPAAHGARITCTEACELLRITVPPADER